MDQPALNFAFIFSLATVGMLVLAGTIIVFVVFYQKRMIQEQVKRQQMELDYQQRMMVAALESQENERRRLSAELHDSIGAMLSTVRVGITTLARQLPEATVLDQSKLMLDDTITAVRRISRDLMPSTLEKFGLSQALFELCDRFQTTSQINIEYEEDKEIEGLELTQQLMVYRIVQELISNALKHAHATKIQIKTTSTDTLNIFVEDNGIGFDVERIKNSKENGSGLGIFNIENRARLIKGSIAYEKNRLTGTRAILTLPHEKV
jgi:two-component system NarL family sensor kinase